MKKIEVYSKSWCPYCNKAKALLGSKDLAYEEIDTTHDEAREREMVERSRRQTVPQIFVGGEFVGGCTETLDAFGEGSFQQRLTGSGVKFNQDLKMDPYKFFPAWLQPRQPQ